MYVLFQESEINEPRHEIFVRPAKAKGGVLDPCPSGSAHTEQYETLVLHVFSLRYAFKNL